MALTRGGHALAHLLAGRIERTSAWAERSYSNLPSFLMVVALIAVTQALGGRQVDAKRAIEEMRKLAPGLRVSNITE